MERAYYLKMAAEGLRMPVGTDLVLHTHPDAKDIMLDGARLGQVMIDAARLYKVPLAIPLMDLKVEKTAMLEILGVAAKEVDKYHFKNVPSQDQMRLLEEGLKNPRNRRWIANKEALVHVAQNAPDLLPVGMSIGPFSFMTKLLADPITAVYLAGSGVTAEEDEEVRAVEVALEMATQTILALVEGQLKAGAKLMFVCEPAANLVFLSPKQVGEGGSDIFDRYVMRPNQRLRALLRRYDADLLFHDCGELTPWMIRRFAELDPVILSLGSPVKLWEAASVLPKNIVLYGNLPSKKFYSDKEITTEQVMAMARDLNEKMKATGHPFILGSECDVLSVPGCEKIIAGKVNAMMSC